MLGHVLAEVSMMCSVKVKVGIKRVHIKYTIKQLRKVKTTYENQQYFRKNEFVLLERKSLIG